MSASIIKMPRPAALPRQLGCSACGATTDAACDCGAPYVPAGQRAAEAVAANPEKSDRAIAAEIGVDHKTVGAARKSVGECSPPEKRLGKDGKNYPAKATREARDETERDRKTCGALYQKLTDAERERAQWLVDHPEHSGDETRPVVVGDDDDELDAETVDGANETVRRRIVISRVNRSISDAEQIENLRKAGLKGSKEIITLLKSVIDTWKKVLDRLSAGSDAVQCAAADPDREDGPDGTPDRAEARSRAVTLTEEWQGILAGWADSVGVPLDELVDLALDIGMTAVARKMRSSLAKNSEIEMWLVKMHSKYPDTFNAGAWEGSCGHLSIDNLSARRSTQTDGAMTALSAPVVTA